jgi:Ca2+-binding RTX toxin-like protein
LSVFSKKKKITKFATVAFAIFVFQISIFLTSDVWADKVVCEVGINEICGGTNKPDIMLGTSKSDDIRGYEGDDNLSGFKGNDFISGYSGSDILSGGPGDDTIYQNTVMSGQSPIDPDGAKDQISCGDGDDTAFINYSTDGDTADKDCETVQVG